MKAYIRRTASVIALAFVAGSGAAFAQEATDAPSGPETIQASQPVDNTPTDKVTITGSRLASGADAPTPVTAVSTDAINQIALPNIADALVQLPAMRTSVTSAKGGQGLTIGSQLNLRNIGSFRTLVLVDGKRFVSTAPFGAGQSIAV
ncbi:MAG TPA: Plug domain-containing protein, partial [Hyphomonadaceae bacterium]|nr:Plug domain-containing protein [Hyphomonadaceae bacterium]